MATLRDLKKRLQTVKNTRQITKAVKMVSASKLRRSQESLLSLRPYAYKLIALLNSVREDISAVEHPLLTRREIKRTRVLVVSSDRGLCGSYNSNIIKRAEKYLVEAELSPQNSVLDFVGKKGFEYFKKRYPNIGDNYRVQNNPSYSDVESIGDRLIDTYIDGDYDSLLVIYNDFKSALSQKITVERLFPSIPPDYSEDISGDRSLYEPSKEGVIKELLPKYVKVELLRIMLESLTSEHGARMTAMESATKNSEEMIKKISLLYNRQRQAAITTELGEIVGGKEALEKG
jgi:F-type H+-transporting ATPase subunit gamma